MANLQGEDKDAWRYYLKRGHKGGIEKALSSCHTAKQKAQVAGYHADMLFENGRYDSAANYYS